MCEKRIDDLKKVDWRTLENQKEYLKTLAIQQECLNSVKTRLSKIRGIKYGK